MLKQKIDPLRLSIALYRLKDEMGCRFSLLDMICLLFINEHSQCGKLDIAEFISFDKIKSKSSLDKPIQRLIDSELIERHYNENAARKLEEPQITYSVTEKGNEFLQQ
ncbi:hypothetical protein M3914_003506 [Vibrio metschnikovii]|nr:hypothetical protein [Vibrio metschnikovii]